MERDALSPPLSLSSGPPSRPLLVTSRDAGQEQMDLLKSEVTPVAEQMYLQQTPPLSPRKGRPGTHCYQWWAPSKLALMTAGGRCKGGPPGVCPQPPLVGRSH